MSSRSPSPGRLETMENCRSQMAYFLDLAGGKHDLASEGAQRYLWWKDGPFEQWIEEVDSSEASSGCCLTAWCRLPRPLGFDFLKQLLLWTHPRYANFELHKALWSQSAFGLRWSAHSEVHHWLKVAEWQRTACRQLLKLSLEGR